MFDLGKTEIDFKCPKCQRVNKVKLIQVKREEVIICVGCQSRIKLEDKDGTISKSIKSIDDSINNLFKK